MIALVDYGAGNLTSVRKALTALGAEFTVPSSPEECRRARGIIVPGVGHFGACMANLRERGLDAVVKEFAASGRPMFGVCVGMQVLLEGSEEAPDVPGLGLIAGTSRRLPEVVKVPHMGWNEVSWTADHPYVRDVPETWFYFVHSYAPPTAISGVIGKTRYGAPFAAAIARANVFATQFHPEKSGEPGLALYRAFVREVSAA